MSSLLSTKYGRGIQSIFEQIRNHTQNYVLKLIEQSPYKEIYSETYTITILDDYDVIKVKEILPGSIRSTSPLLPDLNTEHIYSSVMYIKSDPPKMVTLRSVLYDAGGGPALDQQIKILINSLAETIWEEGPPVLDRQDLSPFIKKDRPEQHLYDILDFDTDLEYISLPLSEIKPCVKSSLTPSNGIAVKLFLQIKITENIE